MTDSDSDSDPDTESPTADFQLYRDAASEWRWRFVVPNGNTIAESGEGYHNRADAINGIKALEREIHAAPILDMTEAEGSPSRRVRFQRRFRDLAERARQRVASDTAADGERE